MGRSRCCRALGNFSVFIANRVKFFSRSHSIGNLHALRHLNSIVSRPASPASIVYLQRHSLKAQVPEWIRPMQSQKFSIESEKSSIDISKEMDSINRVFAEAREEIEMAMESKESVYFNEEAECAKEAVDKVLKLYHELLEKINEDEKGIVQRSMGLKLEQLKAELGQLVDP